MSKIIKNKKVYEENISEIEGKALAIVFPDTSQEIKNLIMLSDDIVPRGSGTSFAGACIPNNSVIIDFSKMNKILDVDSGKKIVVVEPGILLSELNEELEQYNLEFPIIPMFAGIETLGGLISKNSSGSREIKYGKMINWIDSLVVINGKGEEIKVSKSDLSDFVGMEGTTGIILKATLRLTNLKKRSITILKSENLRDIFETNKKLRLNQDICSIDLLNKEISSALGFENKYHLFVEYDNETGVFKKESYNNFYKLKNKAYSKIASEGYYLMESAKVFSESLEDIIFYLEEKKIPYFAYLASGVIFMCFKPTEQLKRYEALKFAKKLRGIISYGMGIGLTGKEFVEIGEKDLIRRIKNRHDPQNKLNRNKIFDAKSIAKQIIEEKFEEKIEKEQVKEENAEEIKEEIEEKLIEEKAAGEIREEKPKEVEQEAQEIIDEVTEKQIEEKKEIERAFEGTGISDTQSEEENDIEEKSQEELKMNDNESKENKDNYIG